MRRSQLQAFLEARAQRGRWTVTGQELLEAFPSTPQVLKVTLHRLVKAGAITRVAPGLFLNREAVAAGKVTLGSLVADLRPNDDCYISLDAALHTHGALQHSPGVVTVVTTGARNAYNTPLGVVDFIPTKRDPAQWRNGLSDVEVNGVPVASVPLALSDYLRLGQPLPPPLQVAIEG